MKKKKEVQTVEETFDNVEIPADLKGLTAAEVQKKIEQGQTNQVEDNLLKTDKEIIKENTINIFNLLDLVSGIISIVSRLTEEHFIFWCGDDQYVNRDYPRITRQTYN